LSAKRETEMKETIGNLESKVKSHTQTIQEMNDRLKSAIVMRPISEELQQRDGDTTHILSNILRNWSPEKQKSLVRGIVGESMIVMRPIAELPDRVPDGCVIVAIRADNTDVFVWRHCRDIKDIVAKNPFEGFYILPLPKPARRLHPCYMPGCGGDGKCVYDYSGSEDRSRKSWFVDCLKCHAQGPRCDSEQEAEQAWGYAE